MEHALQVSSLQKKTQPNKIIRKGSKLAQPPFAANASYEKLSFKSPEFEPFREKQQVIQEKPAYIPLTEQERNKILQNKKKILFWTTENAFTPNSRRVIIIANTVFYPEWW